MSQNTSLSSTMVKYAESTTSQAPLATPPTNPRPFPHVQFVQDLTPHVHTASDTSAFYDFSVANAAALTGTASGRDMLHEISARYTTTARPLSPAFRTAFMILWALGSGDGAEMQHRLNFVEWLIYEAELERKELAGRIRSQADLEMVGGLKVLEVRFRWYVAWLRLGVIVERRARGIPDLCWHRRGCMHRQDEADRDVVHGEADTTMTDNSPIPSSPVDSAFSEGIYDDANRDDIHMDADTTTTGNIPIPTSPIDSAFSEGFYSDASDSQSSTDDSSELIDDFTDDESLSDTSEDYDDGRPHLSDRYDDHNRVSEQYEDHNRLSERYEDPMLLSDLLPEFMRAQNRGRDFSDGHGSSRRGSDHSSLGAEVLDVDMDESASEGDHDNDDSGDERMEDAPEDEDEDETTYMQYRWTCGEYDGYDSDMGEL